MLPPDVNESDLYFSAVGEDIRFGLSAIRNVGAHVVEEIIRTRQEKGAFTSFTDFLDKVPLSVCNKRTIESLIKGGAFDELGAHRLWLDVKPFNDRARALYRSEGFVEEGVLRGALLEPDGTFQDLVVMSLLRPEWAP